MTFLNESTLMPTTTSTVLPDFQYLTSPSTDPSLSTTTSNHIPIYHPIPNSIDINQYNHNNTNITTTRSSPGHLSQVHHSFLSSSIDRDFRSIHRRMNLSMALSINQQATVLVVS